jgi:hypothetical protein
VREHKLFGLRLREHWRAARGEDSDKPADTKLQNATPPDCGKKLRANSLCCHDSPPGSVRNT